MSGLLLLGLVHSYGAALSWCWSGLQVERVLQLSAPGQWQGVHSPLGALPVWGCKHHAKGAVQAGGGAYCPVRGILVKGGCVCMCSIAVGHLPRVCGLAWVLHLLA